MHAKNNRTNSDFQLANFVAGSCHTPDGAWALLWDQLEGRTLALEHARAQALRAKAKELRATTKLDNWDTEAEHLLAQADLIEVAADRVVADRCVAACEAEIATIRGLMAQLEPQRKFAHLSDVDAHQAAQAGEWTAEIRHRIENQMLAHGGITADLLGTARLIPTFETDILPLLSQTRAGTALAHTSPLQLESQ